MIIKVSFVVVASVAAFAVTQINIKCSSKRSSLIKPPDNDDSSSQQLQIEGEEKEDFADYVSVEEEEEVKRTRSTMKQNLKPNFPQKGDSEKIEFSTYERKLNNVTEIKMLNKIVKEMEQRKVTLEGKLVVLYGLKEQQSCIAQLNRHLEDKKTEIHMLNITVNSLHSERRKLQEEIKQGVLAEKQLEMAKNMIKEMQTKMRVDANQMKGQLMMLEEQVSSFHREEICIRDATVEKKLKLVKDLELVVVEMMRRNKELQLEKRDLSIKLVDAQAKIAALSNMTESTNIAKVEEETSSLRHTNEDLLKQVESLQKNRFGMVEELVYERWVNACLRFEVQNYLTPLRKTKSDLSKNSSLESQEKTKHIMRDPSFDCISSHTSSAESDEINSTTNDSSSNSQKSFRKKFSLIHNIKKWGRSKDDSSIVSLPSWSSRENSLSRGGLIRRLSMSTVPSDTSMPRSNGDNAFITSSRKKKVQDSTVSPETPSSPRLRKVSFSDSVKTIAITFQDMPKSIKGVLDDDQQKVAKSLEDNSIINTSYNDSGAKLEEERPESSSLKLDVVTAGRQGNSSRQGNENKKVETQVVNKIEIAHIEELHSRMPDVPPNNNKVDTQVLHLIASFLFFLLMLLVYFSLVSAGFY